MIPSKSSRIYVQKNRNKFEIFFLYPALLLCVIAATQNQADADTNDTNVVTMSTSTLLDIAAAEARERAEAEAAAAAEAAMLKSQIEQKNSELDDIKKNIAAYEKQLTFTQKEAKTLQNTVKSLDLDRRKMSANIQLTQKQLETSALSLSELGLGIEDTESKIASTNRAVGEILRTMDQADSKTIVETLLSKHNLSEIMDDGMQLSQLRDQVRERIRQLAAYKVNLQKEKNKVETEKKKLASYQSKLSDQKAVLDVAKKEKSDLLSLTRDRESDYQKILDANKAKKEAFEKELFDYESKLTRQLDRKFIPELGSKILAWPLDSILITQHFGKTKDSVRLYSSGTHNGMDFSANRGTPVKSPAKGEVIATGNTDLTCSKASYGKWVLIRHNNGLTTLMAHFDVIKVSAGQSLSVGDLVGYSGNTGYSTGPHLHLTVFASDGVQVGSFASKSCTGKDFTMPLPTAKNAYLDPEAYLPEH